MAANSIGVHMNNAPSAFRDKQKNGQRQEPNTEIRHPAAYELAAKCPGLRSGTWAFWFCACGVTIALGPAVRDWPPGRRALCYWAGRWG